MLHNLPHFSGFSALFSFIRCSLSLFSAYLLFWPIFCFFRRSKYSHCSAILTPAGILFHICFKLYFFRAHRIFAKEEAKNGRDPDVRFFSCRQGVTDFQVIFVIFFCFAWRVKLLSFFLCVSLLIILLRFCGFSSIFATSLPGVYVVCSYFVDLCQFLFSLLNSLQCFLQW